jgi:phenylpropionate dioxygenase-like ring-hydroxylating dioxygenase large terminal subunit
LAPWRFEQMRFRSYRTVILPANWKTVIDAFNESYHVQGSHPQLLLTTDDTNSQNERLGKHSNMGSLLTGGGRKRRQLRPSPRLGLSDDDWDERELLSLMVNELSGSYYKEELELVERLRTEPLPEGRTALEIFNELRVEMLRRKGIDLSGFPPDDILSGGDVHYFPNVVGPFNPGSTTLFRVRPNGLNPESTIKDLWTIEWVGEGDEREMCERKFYPEWQQKDWGLVTNQDYANIVHVQAGMHSRACKGLRLNPRQENNLIHMHQVIDQYLMS